ncbi:hypothetical protein [Litoribrevibacter albus]|uniref:Uncharacterized protein n=1 Tax=Litoribrevibacter albus TaxID=1473156 RepID=A0AA37SE94_9GAMM|nr:hypothetical protein [Litoribrevibacter albus]GLQ32702.1 hypothetical protein GCM10007876_31810 [Litoribrevibacter albus]
MRRFKSLPEDDQAKLRDQFLDIEKAIAVEETPVYTYLAISVFDHWLTRSEFYEHLVDVSDKEQDIRNQALYSFSKKVISETQVLNFKWARSKGKQIVKFRDFTSREAKFEYFLPAVSESDKNFFQSVLPDLGIIFLENYEDTNIMYLKDISVKPKIEKWASESGVFCLEKWA